jgi:hypothetical protein
MAQIEIPEAWRKTVCAILRTEDLNLITWTLDASQRYQADYTTISEAVWQYEVYTPLCGFLEVGRPIGCLIVMDRPPGETYEFFFLFRSKKAYGKILLRSDRNSIVLLSAHRPLRAALSCE